MSFKYSCIGDNTPENREWLEKVGYKDQMIKGNSILYACNGEAYTTEPHYPSFKLIQKERVLDCRSNPELFRAVTAMREDSDKDQYFKNGDSWILCSRHSFGDYAYIYGFKTNRWQKANLEELINHFKMEVCPDNNAMKVFRKKA